MGELGPRVATCSVLQRSCSSCAHRREAACSSRRRSFTNICATEKLDPIRAATGVRMIVLAHHTRRQIGKATLSRTVRLGLGLLAALRLHALPSRVLHPCINRRLHWDCGTWSVEGLLRTGLEPIRAMQNSFGSNKGPDHPRGV